MKLPSILCSQWRFGIVAVILFSACGSEPKPNRNVQIAEEKKALDVYQDDQNSGDAVQAASIFATICKQMGITDITTSPTQLELAKLCNDDKPTSLLAAKLPSIAYAPSQEVKLLQLETPAHDQQNATTGVTVAAAVKLPISAQHYFEMMTALMDDNERAKELGVKLVAGQTQNDTEEEFEEERNLFVKGWSKHIRVETDVSNQLVVSEYINRQDHWTLVPEKAYAINSYLTTSLEGIKDGRMLSIIVQGGNQAYLLTTIHTTTDNRGLPSVALDTLIKTYKSGIENAYNNAVLIAEETP